MDNQDKVPAAPVLGVFLGFCAVVAGLMLVAYNVVGSF